jgi:uncharacterized membrane protein
MREVASPSSSDPDGFVPGLAILVAFVLILVSIVVLVSYVHHIGRALRVASLIDSVGDDTRALLLELYPTDTSELEQRMDFPEGEPTRIVSATTSGVLHKIDEDELVELASDADSTVVLGPRLGDFVPEGADVFAVYGSAGTDDSELLHGIALGKERTLHQDLAYGLRMLVDVAVRSLSATMGDPTTAVQAIDRLHDCLRQLVVRPFPSGCHYDSAGRLRLVVPVLSWEGYVRLAVDELRYYAVSSIQVTRRLTAMLEDLLRVAPEDRRPPIERQLQLLREMAQDEFRRGDVEHALVADQQGVGSGADHILQPVSSS